MIMTGGKFDKDDKNIYFLASGPGVEGAQKCHNEILIAINEVESETNKENFDNLLNRGKKIFVDSGIFNLCMEHVRITGITHDEALSLAPEEITGFEELWNKYTSFIDRFGDRVWGYIELDQGGKDNKMKTRARLEALGYRPVPVYHPYLDGWDYFDYLAENYDRICFGNVVQATISERVRLIMTAYERKQKYPHLWIHLLGYTPSEWMNAIPIDSCDSSTWLSCVRWAGVNERTDGKSIGPIYRNFQYELGADIDSEVGKMRGLELSAYSVELHQRNWRNHLSDLYVRIGERKEG